MDRKEYYKEYYKKNRIKKLESSRKRHNTIKDNPEFKKHKQEYYKKYYELNKHKIIARTSKNNIKAVQTNLHTRIAQRLRTRIYIVLRRNKKYFKLKDIVGCSLEELKQHLESKFSNGMSWENYGRYGWHVDHIIPCSHFNLSEVDEQLKCFNYKNLQPLWATDNLRKHNKLETKQKVDE